MVPPNCTSVSEIPAQQAFAFIDLIIARVLVVREGKFFTINDFGSRIVSGAHAEVLINYSDEWCGHPRVKHGDVVVLRRFKKLKGYAKNNSMLYFNRAESSVMFYGARKQVFGKHCFRMPSDSMEEFRPGSENHRYVVSLIDDWNKQPREASKPKTPSFSTVMSLKEAHDAYDTTRLVTVKGKLSRNLKGQFYLTDSPLWVARLEGFEIQEALEHQHQQKITSYIKITCAKPQEFLKHQRDGAKMRLKITDRSNISTLLPQERRLLEEKLAAKHTPKPTPKPIPRPTAYIATPDQSRERVSYLENLDVWEPEEDELDAVFAAVKQSKRPEEANNAEKSDTSCDIATSSNPGETPQTPQTPKSEINVSSEVDVDSDDSLDSFTDFIYHGARRGKPYLASTALTHGEPNKQRNEPQPSGQSMMTSTPKTNAPGASTHELSAQLLQCVAGSSDSEDHYSSPVRKRSKTTHAVPLSRH